MPKQWPVAALDSTSQPRVGMKRNSPTNGTDLSVALQTFNEETMVQACSLLLSERDYQEDAVEEESDYAALVSIFVKCKDAARIVEQQATFLPMKLPPLYQSAPPPTPAAITPSARAAASAARTLKAQGHLNSMNPPRRMSLAQMARTGARAKGTLVPHQKPVMKRVPSDSSLTSMNSASSRSSAKKSRVQPVVGVTAAAIKSESAVPPPEALQLLQALNNQQAKQEDDEIPSPTEESKTARSRTAKVTSKKPPPGQRVSSRKRA
jgi:hypothetical protein